MPYVVGLTGGIGSGKREVARAFAALGVDVARCRRGRACADGPGEPGHRAVVEAFGPTSLATRRQRSTATGCAQRVFADPAVARRLERLLHPLIRAARSSERRARGTGPTASWSCRCCSSAAACCSRVDARAGRRLPGRRAGSPRRRAQRADAGRGARDHGDAAVARRAPRARRRRHRQQRSARSASRRRSSASIARYRDLAARATRHRRPYPAQ